MKTKTDLMLALDDYRKAVDESLQGVRQLIAAERYEDAAKLMTSVSTAQAQMSVKMQGAMQRLEESRV